MYTACARAVFCNEKTGAAVNVLDCSLVSLLEPSRLLKLSVDCIRSLQSLDTDPSCINYQPIRLLATVQLIHLLNVLSFFLLPCNECKSNIHSISSGFGLHQLQELLDDLLCCVRVAKRHL